MARARQAEHWADPERLGKSMCGNLLESLERIVGLDKRASCGGCKNRRRKLETPKIPVRKPMVHWEDPLLNVRGYFRCRGLAATKTAKTQNRHEITCKGCGDAYDQAHTRHQTLAA